MLPDVSVIEENGALGGLSTTADVICAIIGTGIASASLALSVPKVIYNLNDAIALEIKSTGDNIAAYRHIKEFYDAAGTDSELYIMLVPDTMTLAQMMDKTNANGIKKLLDYSRGRVTLATCFRVPPGGYTPTLTLGIDGDCFTAVTNAQALGDDYKTNRHAPLALLIEGRSYLHANVASLKDLKTGTSDMAGIVLWSTDDDGSSSVGLVMGWVVRGGISRNIGRVKTGALPIAAAYIGNTAVEDESALGAIHDKGYIIARRFPGRDGYYMNDDPLATAASNDYSSLANRMVINKAHRIAYRVYTEEINDDTEIENGKIHPAVIKYLEDKIVRTTMLEMAGQISSVVCSINPAQNVSSTKRLDIDERVRPKAYFRDIRLFLGMENTQL